MGQNPVPSEREAPEDRIELIQILKTLWRSKWILAGLTLLFAALFLAVVSQGTELYRARASLMLDPRSVQVLSSQEVVSDLDLNTSLIETEVAVLRSNMLLERVIEQVDPVWLEMLDPANVEPSALDRLRATLRGYLAQLTGEEAAPAVPADAAAADPDELDRRTRRLIGAIRRSMQVWRVGQSYLISVAFETRSPELSMILANTVVQAYIEDQVDSRTQTVRSASSFLADRVEEMRASVEAAESRVEDIRTSQIEQAGASLVTVENQLQDLSTQLALAQADLAQSRARYEQIDRIIQSDGFAAAAELLTSPFVLSLREQLSTLLREDADLALRYGPDHPDRLRTRSEIELLTAELADEVRKIVAVMRNDVEVARIRADSIRDSLTEMENRVAALSRSNLLLRQLELEADSVRITYQEMLNRLNETRSTELLQRADARQVERAVVPGAPSSPRVLLLTVFGACLGFAVGLVVVYLRSVTSTGFMSARELEKATGLPVVTSLLRERWRNHHAMLRDLKRRPYQRFAERLRQLRTTMLMRREEGMPGECVVLTSTLGGEGKTTMALGLAYLEHLAGRHCVVVDFDLRKSMLPKEFGYKAETDLKGLLLENKPIRDALNRVQDYGFHLISLNTPAPHLADRLEFDHLKALISILREQYDLVILDTAPVLLVSETLQAARLADRSILLVRQGKTRRSAVLEAIRKLESVGPNDVSIVMTMGDPRVETNTYGSNAYADYGQARSGA